MVLDTLFPRFLDFHNICSLLFHRVAHRSLHHISWKEYWTAFSSYDCQFWHRFSGFTHACTHVRPKLFLCLCHTHKRSCSVGLVFAFTRNQSRRKSNLGSWKKINAKWKNSEPTMCRLLHLYRPANHQAGLELFFCSNSLRYDQIVSHNIPCSVLSLQHWYQIRMVFHPDKWRQEIVNHNKDANDCFYFEYSANSVRLAETSSLFRLHRIRHLHLAYYFDYLFNRKLIWSSSDWKPNKKADDLGSDRGRHTYFIMWKSHEHRYQCLLLSVCYHLLFNMACFSVVDIGIVKRKDK